MFHGGVRAHYVTTALCARLLRASPRALVVTISVPPTTDAPVAYSVAKTADDRLAQAIAAAFTPHGVASVALHPGLVRTEGVMQFAEHLDLTASQSPEGVGRVVAALADDVNIMSRNGRALLVADLAELYGIDVTT